ncbi:probable 2-oxoglutarate-dependent dioxygenase AOP1 [Lycium barbarum]|uniref:probable 2-oxoglutarate-dependent dioxygenase AOP1 n=1 Tax=Lycium barbarum TaxID=112863 RepID=UPI00293E046C|nr:probable 2-oxoglutarate-dependent dioxygenase AOP1 [Lycium barbarum]
MTISKELKVPTIDFCNPELKPGTPQWESTKTQVIQALQEYGIFEAVYDKVPREAIFNTSKKIFEFPLETKLETKSTIPMHGYLGQYPQLPAYESLGIADVLKSESVDSIANIFWPDGNPDFSNVLKTFSEPLVELDETIKKMILESLGLKSYIDEFLESYFYNFRFTHYNPALVNGEEGDKPGLSIHTDSGFLTFIFQNSVNGLEVQTKNGEWIDVNIAPNSLVVIVGDSFMAWTNGRLHSPVHRVTLSENSERFSIPLFTVPKEGYIIEPRKELVDEEHPLLFKPYNILELYKFVMSKEGASKAGSEAFKAFCGV